MVGKNSEGGLTYYEKRCNFKGSLIIVNNLKHGSDELAKSYSDALRDRASEIFFSWERQDIAIYVDKLAFEGGGLLKYMYAANTGPEDSRGLGFKGDRSEAMLVLHDVRGFFISHFGEIKTISFRILRDLTFDRVHYGRDDWLKMAAERLV